MRAPKERHRLKIVDTLGQTSLCLRAVVHRPDAAVYFWGGKMTSTPVITCTLGKPFSVTSIR